MRPSVPSPHRRGFGLGWLAVLVGVASLSPWERVRCRAGQAGGPRPAPSPHGRGFGLNLDWADPSKVFLSHWERVPVRAPPARKTKDASPGPACAAAPAGATPWLSFPLSMSKQGRRGCAAHPWPSSPLSVSERGPGGEVPPPSHSARAAESPFHATHGTLPPLHKQAHRGHVAAWEYADAETRRRGDVAMAHPSPAASPWRHQVVKIRKEELPCRSASTV